MKEVIFIGPLNLGKIALGGDHVKNRFLLNNIQKHRNVLVIDTYKWQTKPLLLIKIIYLSVTVFNKSQRIIMSVSPVSGLKFLMILNYLNVRLSKLDFFVIGNLHSYFTNYHNKKLLNSLNQIIVETNNMAQILVSNGINRGLIMNNFKNFSLEKLKIREQNKTNEQKKLRLLYISRINEEKGVEILFRAINVLKKSDFTLDFYGPISKEYNQRFERLIDENENCCYKGILNLNDSVADYNEQIDNLSFKYDVFVFPTIWKYEGNPGVFIDAFCAGLPIVCSRWMDLGDFVVEGKNGLMFTPKDHIDFSEKIEFLRANPTKRLELRKNAFESANAYHVDSVMIEYIKDLN